MKLLKLTAFFLMIATGAYSQSLVFPAPFQINADTLTGTPLPYANWQFLRESGHELSLNEVLKAPASNNFKHKKASEENETIIDGVWLRCQIKNNLAAPLAITLFEGQSSRADVYISADGLKWNHKVSGQFIPWSKRDGLKRIMQVTCTIPANGTITVYEREINTLDGIDPNVKIGVEDKIINKNYVRNDAYFSDSTYAAALFGFLVFAAIFNFFFFYTVREKVYLLFGIILSLIALISLTVPLSDLFLTEYPATVSLTSIAVLGVITFLLMITVPMFLHIGKNYPKWNKLLFTVSVVFLILWPSIYFTHVSKVAFVMVIVTNVLLCFVFMSIVVLFILDLIKKRRQAGLIVMAFAPFITVTLLVIIPFYLIFGNMPGWLGMIRQITLLWPVLVLSWSLFDRFRAILHENARQAIEKERLAREKEEERNQLISQQKEELEIQVTERTAELKKSLIDLTATQAQLIQKEKLASLGELTAGIAHEIQNPLNFVNNFSDVNREMLQELKAESIKPKAERDEQLQIELINDLIENEGKINHHGKRADSIVKGMLEHSRTGTGERQPTDLNVLCDEFMKLSYHGLRAKDKNFNAEMITHFDEKLPLANLSQQDIGRVMLNLFNNAFYAVNQKQKTAAANYQPEVTVATASEAGHIVISVKDNGTGIPQKVLDKIYQPFFTTKPTGQGTGLGLSLSYDIVKVHNGEIEVKTIEGSFTEFIVTLPAN